MVVLSEILELNTIINDGWISYPLSRQL